MKIQPLAVLKSQQVGTQTGRTHLRCPGPFFQKAEVPSSRGQRGPRGPTEFPFGQPSVDGKGGDTTSLLIWTLESSAVKMGMNQDHMLTGFRAGRGPGRPRISCQLYNELGV